MTGFELVAATSVYLLAGSPFVTAYFRFTHAQTLSDDETATRLLESNKLSGYWPAVLIPMLILLFWWLLFIIDTLRWTAGLASTFKNRNQT